MADAAIAILGGSSAWTPLLAVALAERASELGEVDIRLLGRDLRRTELVARVCAAQAQRRGAAHRWRAVDSLAAAVDGARVVVNQMRIGGFAARCADEALPLRHGLPGDETIGPGGLSAALRSVPPTVAIGAQVAARAPGCWFVNMANPMGILTRALAERVPGLACFGLCELPQVTLAAGLRLLGKVEVDLCTRPDAVDYVGINHQGFLCRAMVNGTDVVPAILEALAAREAAAGAPLAPFQIDAAAMRPYAALPLPYLRFYLHRERTVAAQQVSGRGAVLGDLADRVFAAYRSNPDGELPPLLRQRATPWLELALAPALVALLGGPSATLYVTQRNLTQHDRRHLPFLPADAIVEQRARVATAGLTPLPPTAASLTHPARNALLDAIATFEREATTAALEPTDRRIRAALAAHPFAAALTSAQLDALSTELRALHTPRHHGETAS